MNNRHKYDAFAKHTKTWDEKCLLAMDFVNKMDGQDIVAAAYGFFKAKQWVELDDTYSKFSTRFENWVQTWNKRTKKVLFYYIPNKKEIHSPPHGILMDPNLLLPELGIFDVRNKVTVGTKFKTQHERVYADIFHGETGVYLGMVEKSNLFGANKKLKKREARAFTLALKNYKREKAIIAEEKEKKATLKKAREKNLLAAKKQAKRREKARINQLRKEAEKREKTAVRVVLPIGIKNFDSYICDLNRWEEKSGVPRFPAKLITIKKKGSKVRQEVECHGSMVEMIEKEVFDNYLSEKEKAAQVWDDL